MTQETLNAAFERFKERTGYMPHALKAALIDMDGTLYDSMPWHARAWHRMVTEIGIKSTVEEFFNYEGMTGKATVNMLLMREFGRGATDEEAAELYNRKSEYFRQMNQVKIMPGAKEMVSVFRSSGMTPVLVTGSGQASLLDRISNDFDGNFPPELRITARNVKHGKPSPEPYLEGLKLVGIQPWEALVIENAPLGVKSGADAGIFTIGITTGPLPKNALKEAGADMVFDSMSDFAFYLPEIINFINIMRTQPCPNN